MMHVLCAAVRLETLLKKTEHATRNTFKRAPMLQGIGAQGLSAWGLKHLPGP